MFLMLLRVYFKGNNKQNSVQYFMLSDYNNSVDDMVRAGKARYHNVIAADLGDADVTYNAAYLMDQAGNAVEPFFCDDRRPSPAPEPEQ